MGATGEWALRERDRSKRPRFRRSSRRDERRWESWGTRYPLRRRRRRARGRFGQSDTRNVRFMLGLNPFESVAGRGAARSDPMILSRPAPGRKPHLGGYPVATFVLYHAHCADGFGAAWAAWKRFGAEARYLAVQHGAPAPSLPEGSEVYILDFAYTRAETETIRRRAASLRVIDHHRTAEEELRGLDYATFDNRKSGAVLSWEFFHPGKPVPENPPLRDGPRPLAPRSCRGAARSSRD